MRKILFIYTDKFKIHDIAWAFLELNYEMKFFDREFFTYQKEQTENAELLRKELKGNAYWFILSYNFVPQISEICTEFEIPYVCWTFDSPTLPLHTEQIKSPYNFTYVFDSEEYNLVKANLNPPHIFYMPLAANTSRLGGTIITETDIDRFSSDVSFVGNLYTYDEYHEIEKINILPTAIRDYIEYLFDYYTGRWDSESIYDCFNDEICEHFNHFLPEGYRNKYLIPDKYYYAMILISRRIANRDRMFMLEHLSHCFDVTLYGPKQELPFYIRQRGEVRYNEEFAKVANLSKINLHVTIPRIATGISQRCFDVMGSCGFLMANYRADMLKHFEPDRDFVMYTSIEELEDKIRYYLQHDDERMQIARNGYQNVLENHTMIHRAKEMIQNLEKAGFPL